MAILVSAGAKLIGPNEGGFRCFDVPDRFLSGKINVDAKDYFNKINPKDEQDAEIYARRILSMCKSKFVDTYLQFVGIINQEKITIYDINKDDLI